jgi:transposase
MVDGNDEGMVTMSGKERERLRVVQAVWSRRMKQGQAAAQLGLSVRQVKRLVRAYRDGGAKALVSKRRGVPSNCRIAARERERILKLVARHYPDFGPTLAAEYLRDRHGFTHAVETLRQWLIGAGRHRPKRCQRTRPYQLRERRAQVGELVQIDGSPHAWLEERGPRCTLLAFVDDATSRLQYAHFVGAETTRAYLQGLRTYVGVHGRPVAFYSDRHSIFRKHDPEDPEPTQFERAVRALDIAPILALSPQAKGRVERTFQTLQDRLVKALRLAGINSLAAANAFLPTFLAQYNAQFGKPPREPSDAHRPLHLSPEQLLFTTCAQHPRKLSKSLSCQYQGQIYLIQTGASPGYHLRGAAVTVCDDGGDQALALLRAGRPLPFKVFPRHTLLPRLADDKTVNEMVDTAKRKQATTHKPNPATHPWKAPINPAAATPLCQYDLRHLPQSN